MIISRTPFRVSFFGGGTDYPSWYREHGGAVLSATLDKYCYILCRYLPPFFEHRLRMVYSKIENCNSIDEIQHPAAREVIRYLGIDRGLEVHHDGDLPARSGMGSSSAFTVGLLNGLSALQGRMLSKYELARTAIHIEQDIIKEAVGSQDQVAVAHGGLNYIRFFENGEISVRPVTITPERMGALSNHLCLFYTGIIRTAANVAKSYDFTGRRRELRVMKDLVKEGLGVLTGDQDLTYFGELLHESWLAKKSLSQQVTNSDVDDMYEAAMKNGAVGGKIIGAGGGGFLLLFAPPERHEAIRAALSRLIHVPFNFEFQGSQIIFYDTWQDYVAEEERRAAQKVGPFRELPVVGEEPATGSGS